jgi:hypothetical protein
MVVGITLSGVTKPSSFSSLESGTVIIPTFGSIVQNGKFADCAFALERQLNNVDFPTLGNPTIPHFNAIANFYKATKIKKLVGYSEPT